MCSDMVILDEEDAVLIDEYNTLQTQMTSPIIDCLSKDDCWEIISIFYLCINMLVLINMQVN